MNTRSIALLASLALFAGCTTTHSIRPDSLNALDGFNAATPEGRLRVLTEEDGTKVEYKPGRALEFTFLSGNAAGGRFDRIDAREGLLVATLRGGRRSWASREPSLPALLSLDPSKVKTAELTYFSVWKTVVLSTILTSLTVGMVALVYVGANFHIGGFGGALGP